MKDTESVSVNNILLEECRDLMQIDKQFPINNITILFAILMDKFLEDWKSIKDKKSPDAFVRYYKETMERIEKLKKKSLIKEDARNIRSLEDVKNAL